MNRPDEILPLLEAIEWEGDTHHHQCPSCRRHKVQGHEKGCDLDVLLRKLKHAARVGESHANDSR